MGRIFKVEAVALGKAADDLATALKLAETRDVLDVPHTAMNLVIAGGIVEIGREDGGDEV